MAQQEAIPIKRIRTRISKGYQVVVPSELRKKYEVGEGDEVFWEISDKELVVKLKKRPSISNIVGLGRSGRKESSVRLKKRVQRGEL